MLLAILAAACFLEKRELDRRGLPEPWIAAAALGLAITLMAGTVQGLLQARRLQAQPQTPPEQWRTGQLIRVGGTIRITGAAPKTPFTHREAVLFEYEASAPELANAASKRSGLVWKGMDMAQCALETSHGRIMLTGFPSLKHFPIQNLRSPDFMPQAARKLATTDWKFLPDILNASLSEAERDFANAGGEMPVNRINRTAAEWLDIEAGKGSDQHFLDRLAQRNWNFFERLVAPGDEVTVVGTYHESPRRVDIALSVRNHQHALYPGGAAKSAAGEQRTAVVFLMVL
ncbi:MAG: hypothetical protein Q7U75_06725, partial [Desulfobacterales bacterium]|nr:hypothetical protein [Desulfobacterales bacterium]